MSAPAQCRTAQVRHYVLARIERGEWREGEPLPGARDLAAATGVSFLKVQQALETLVLDGVLATRARIGTFVRPGWAQRALRDHLSVFNRRPLLPWIEGVEAALARELPDLRITDAFPRAVFEIKTLLHAQLHHDHYLDLGEIAAGALADAGPVNEAALAPCRMGARLIGVPVIASPRVTVFNPEVLRRHGCPLPAPGWNWDDFMDLVRRLAAVMDPSLVLDWINQPFAWLNLVRRAGGRLFTSDPADPVAVDHPRTVLGLRLFRELGEVLGRPGLDYGAFTDAFAAGEAALSLAPRQFTALLRRRGCTSWDCAPLPAIPGGSDTSGQAADLVCVRDTCTDPEAAQRFLAAMLSPAVQNHFGALGYGVPLRRASAMHSFDPGDARDRLWFDQLGRMSAEPAQESADLARLVVQGVTRLLDVSRDLERDAAELARAARLHHAIRRHRPEQP